VLDMRVQGQVGLSAIAMWGAADGGGSNSKRLTQLSPLLHMSTLVGREGVDVRADVAVGRGVAR
jgi:hypothetical protein